ncbi:MAG TPA: hypothetical protein VM536_16655, partial [Chloroflexia bacterium]|nr:hypothetical protein [Chloroflexia bacterium]
IMPAVLTPPLQQYYDGPLRGIPQDFDLRVVYPPAVPDAGTRNRTAVDATVAGQAGFWLVYNPASDPGGAFLTSMRSGYHERDESRYAFASLYHFATP